MAHFRKKPVVIEAVQYVGPGWVAAGAAFEGPPVPDGVEWVRGVQDGQEGVVPVIKTLEGNLFVSPNDWIITGVKGERYPCKPDIFAATYEPA